MVFNLIDNTCVAKLDYKILNPADWSRLSSIFISKKINAVLKSRGHCDVMLTGGRSAERLYSAWSQLPEFKLLRDVNFYFGDERCVSKDHTDSNYGMVMRTLFHQGVPAQCEIFPMDGANPDRTHAAWCYENILPKRIDVLLLGVGEDGHIASIFPEGQAINEATRRVVPVFGPKPPAERLTITPTVISQAGSVYVLAPGPAKAAVLADLVMRRVNLPAGLILDAMWLLDTALPEITLTEFPELPCPRY